MRFTFLLFMFSLLGWNLKAQIPTVPSPCGSLKSFGMTISGPTTFTLNNLTDFSSSESITVSINIKNNNDRYDLYIAGVITDMVESGTNSIIPVNTFSVIASPAGMPTEFSLSNDYQVLVSAPNKVQNATYNLTIKRNALNSFTQAPGEHTLKLYFAACVR